MSIEIAEETREEKMIFFFFFFLKRLSLTRDVSIPEGFVTLN